MAARRGSPSRRQRPGHGGNPLWPLACSRAILREVNPSQTGALIGRDQELATLRGHLDRAVAGEPSLVLIGGEAGIGKTRLLTELTADSDERVLWGACLPLGERGLPYLALIEMLRTLQDEGEILPEALTGLLTNNQASGRAAHRPQLFQSVLDLLGELADERPLMVVVEDLHWADRSTRDLINFLAALVRRQRILLIASYRSDDLHADHPLHAMLAEWWRRPNVHQLELAPLPSDESLRLVHDRSEGRKLSKDDAMRLVVRSGGNPFFLEELVAGSFAGDTPEPLRQLILRRTTDLPSPVVKLLRTASAGGVNIDEGLLAQVAGLDITAVTDLLREAIDMQMVVIDHNRCRFRHALLAETLQDDLLPAERIEYHAAYADALLSAASPPAPAEVAVHLSEAGRHDEAFKSWIRAAEVAGSHYAFSEARRGYESALALWDQVEAPETVSGQTRLGMRSSLAQAAFLAGEIEVACRIGRELVDEIDPVVDPVGAGVAHDHLARYLFDASDYADVLAIQRRAVELVPDQVSAERAEVLSGLARMLQVENRLSEAIEVGREAVALAEASGAVAAEVAARNTLGVAVGTVEDVDKGIEIIAGALELARKTNNAHEQARALWNMHGFYFWSARWEEHAGHAPQVIDELTTLRCFWVAELMMNVADSLFRLGRWDESAEMIEEARTNDPVRAEAVGLCELHVARGELDDARVLNSSRLSSDTNNDRDTHLFNLVNRAEIELAEGHLDAALSTVDDILDAAKGLEVNLSVAYGIAAGIRAAADLAYQARMDKDDSAEEAALERGARYLESIDEIMLGQGPANGWKREVGALARLTEAESTRLQGRPEPSRWLAAESGWKALKMPYQAAYCRYRWVEASLDAGVDRAAVAPALQDLSRYLTDMGAKPLAKEVHRLARRARVDIGYRLSRDRFGLTDREREVLASVATGATNRQIATTLFISEKTASVHVSNIMRKLSAANRGEAAAIAVKEGLVDLSELTTRV